MSSGYEVVDEDRGGGQEGVASGWKTIRAVFPNFAGLPAKRGDFKSSAVLKCHGLEWNILLYPGGHSNSSEDGVFVSIHLYSKSCSPNTNKIRAKMRFRVPSAGKTKGGDRLKIYSTGGKSWGHNNYAKREDFLHMNI